MNSKDREDVDRENDDDDDGAMQHIWNRVVNVSFNDDTMFTEAHPWYADNVEAKISMCFNRCRRTFPAVVPPHLNTSTIVES